MRTWRWLCALIVAGLIAGTASGQVMLRSLPTNSVWIGGGLGYFHAGPLHWSIEGADIRDNLGKLTARLISTPNSRARYWFIGASGSGNTSRRARIMALAWPLSNEPPSVAWSLNQIPRRLPDTMAMAVGNFDGDNFPDLVTCLRNPDSLALYRGVSNGLFNAQQFTIAYAATHQSYRRHLEVRDINGDGLDDVLYARNSAYGATGAVHLFLGSPNGLKAKPDWTGKGQAVGEAFGAALAVLDVNGDGKPDLAVSSRPRAAGREKVSIFLGTNGVFAESPVLVLTAPIPGYRFGWQLSALGDIDHDGYEDLAVGAPGKPDSTNDWPGMVYLFTGGPRGLVAEPKWILKGPLRLSEFGSAVCGIGDVNGDGWPELLVSAPGMNRGYGLPGQVFLFMGGPDGVKSRADWQFSAMYPRQSTGESLAALGDVNGDGLADFAIASPNYTTIEGHREQIGRIDVFFGHRTAYQKRADFPTDGTNSWPVAAAMSFLNSWQPELAARIQATNSLMLYEETERRRRVETNRLGSLVASKEQERQTTAKRMERLRLALAIGVPLLLVVAALWWKRQRRRVALDSAEGERVRLARDLHDGLGSGVHRVQRLTELLDALDAASPEAQKYREDLRRTSVELSGALGETIWSVKPENDTLEHLLSFLANQGPKLLEPHGIACRLELPDQLPNVTLPGNARQQILYAAKEALNNVVKHSKAQRAWLRVTWAEPWLTIAIEDDGCGIKSTTCAPKNASTGGNGLRNLQTRMESLGGTSVIQPRESGGTRLILRVPLPRAG